MSRRACGHVHRQFLSVHLKVRGNCVSCCTIPCAHVALSQPLRAQAAVQGHTARYAGVGAHDSVDPSAQPTHASPTAAGPATAGCAGMQQGVCVYGCVCLLPHPTQYVRRPRWQGVQVCTKGWVHARIPGLLACLRSIIVICFGTLLHNGWWSMLLL